MSTPVRKTLAGKANHAQKKSALDTEAVGVAVDMLSINYGLSADFITHYTWLPENRWGGGEIMANLDQLPATGATLVVGAPKHQGDTGGPCRLIALV